MMLILRLFGVAALLAAPACASESELTAPFHLHPVSASAVGPTTVLVSDYNDILLVDVDRGSVRKLKPELERTDSGQPVASGYMPTGVTYSQASRRLYVANYKFDGVLEATLDASVDGLHIGRAIGDAATLSPENTAVSEDLGLIAVANYDGNSVQAFRISDGKLVWTYQLSGAHGVAFLPDGRLVATGLTGVRIAVLDGLTGAPLAMPDRGSALGRPTAVAAVPDAFRSFGAFAVLDANFGEITFFDDQYRVTRAFGRNGVAAMDFLRPYGLAFVGHFMVVADTYKRRLVVFDEHLQFVREVDLDKPRTQVGSPVAYDRAMPLCAEEEVPPGMDAYLRHLYPEFAGTEFRFRAGFARICVVRAATLVARLNSPSIGDGRPMFGLSLSWTSELSWGDRQLGLWGAPDSRAFVVLDYDRMAHVLVPVPEDWTLWKPDSDSLPQIRRLLSEYGIDTRLDSASAQCGGIETKIAASARRGAPIDAFLDTAEGRAALVDPAKVSTVHAFEDRVLLSRLAATRCNLQ